eukprot:61554_1
MEKITEYAKSQIQEFYKSCHELMRMDWRRKLNQMMNLALIVLSALMIWKGLMVVTGSESPIVVVLSGSMEPAFYRGDILFLGQGTPSKWFPLVVGDVVVFKLEGKEIPIVHRLLEIHADSSGKTRLLTKGDNNDSNDRGLYNRGQWWIGEKDLIGRVRGYLPYVGYFTIILNEKPVFKWALVAAMGIFVLFSREDEK